MILRAIKKQVKFIIVPIWFIRYKFMNSLFLGLSVGAVFTLYSPLNPSIYSLGGIFLAIGILMVSRFYHKILNAYYLFIISLFVEVVLLIAMVYFLFSPYEYQSALIIYIAYQATFIFGSYLVRAETLLLVEDRLLTRVDTAKQLGYLLGMAISYLFYRVLDYYTITDSQTQVYDLHFVLIFVEVVVIWLVVRSFRR